MGCVVVLNVKEMTASVEHFLTRCELACLMQDLIGSYIMMEEYFMRQMVVKVTPTTLQLTEFIPSQWRHLWNVKNIVCLV